VAPGAARMSLLQWNVADPPPDVGLRRRPGSESTWSLLPARVEPPGGSDRSKQQGQAD
jgi:hypothetical protein